MDWLQIARNYEQEFISKVQILLRIPTVLEKFEPNNVEAPFGLEIRKALDYMLTTAENDGFKTKNVLNYAGHIEMGEGKEILAVLGHLDVVPAGGKWDFNPFGAELKDGKIFARGAMDDKGPTIAAYIAFRMLQDQHIKLNKRVRLILGCDEESGMRCIQTYLQEETMPDLGFAPDAEFPLIYAEKGNFSFDITGHSEDDLIESMTAGERYNVVPDECVATLKKDLSKEFKAYLQVNNIQGTVEGSKYTVIGKNAHAATPEQGVNAIFLMIEFLKNHTSSPFVRYIDQYLSFSHFGKKLGIDHYDVEMKEMTINTAIVKYGNDGFTIGCNIRFPRGFDFEKKTNLIKQSATSLGLDYHQHRHSNPHYVSPTDPLVQTLHQAYIKYTNDDKTPLLTIGGGTYARTLKKAVAFGPAMPGKEELIHQPNEYLIVEDLLVAAAIYAESIEQLCKEGN
jgi:succinyl-diaminopimelate desuccinylase